MDMADILWFWNGVISWISLEHGAKKTVCYLSNGSDGILMVIHLGPLADSHPKVTHGPGMDQNGVPNGVINYK